MAKKAGEVVVSPLAWEVVVVVVVVAMSVILLAALLEAGAEWLKCAPLACVVFIECGSS